MNTKKFFSAIAVIAVSVISLCSFTINNNSNCKIVKDAQVHAQGAHCRYTIGCGCTGFSPSGPDVYKLYICKRCGHHKSYHK